MQTKQSIFFLFFFLGIHFSVLAQQITMVQEGRKTSLRGLSVVSNEVVWVSGSNGQVGKTTDGGKTFRWMTVDGYASRDFRDIEAFDSSVALIMAVDTPAIILKTNDGGLSWKKVFEDPRPGMFLDAMDFDGRKGIVIGDPIGGQIFIAKTADAGDHWTVESKKKKGLSVVEGEAFFASSGTNILLDGSMAYFVSGGMQSRFFIGGKSYPLNLQAGKNSTGANGMALAPSKKSGIIVGGDFANDKRTDSCLMLFSISPEFILRKPSGLPSGYKSGAAYLTERTVLITGTSGVDLSLDGGETWAKVSDKKLHTVACVINSNHVWLTGGNGTVVKIAF